MGTDSQFRRNLLIIAVLHVVVIAAVYFISTWQHAPPKDQVIWLEDGSMGGGDAQPGEAAPEPPPRAEPEPKTEPVPPPVPENAPELISVPPPKPAPSEIVTPQATPEPATPKPTTPKPETPKPETPKPQTPKPQTPKPVTPKPTPKRTPKPKPATPKATPKEDGEEDATPKPKASPSDKPKGTPNAAKAEGTRGATNKPAGPAGGNGPGSGNGKGTAKTGNGSGTSEFGWYFSMIHDRFHNRWDQPTNIARGGPDIVTTLKIRIGRDGTILDREIVHSSGDTTMDQSVMTAAERVQQIDPLPAGLGTGDSLEINIAFKLDQGQ